MSSKRHWELAGKRKSYRCNGRRSSGLEFFDVLEASGVDLTEALLLSEMGASSRECWQALQRACEKVGIEFHVHTVGVNGERINLI